MFTKFFSKNLTDKQSKFVDYYVAEGKTQTEAARLAGYSFPEYEGYRLVRQPRMIQVIQAARQKYYQTNLANVAVSTLQQVMQDPSRKSLDPSLQAHSNITFPNGSQ